MWYVPSSRLLRTFLIAGIFGGVWESLTTSTKIEKKISSWIIFCLLICKNHLHVVQQSTCIAIALHLGDREGEPGGGGVIYELHKLTSSNWYQCEWVSKKEINRLSAYAVLKIFAKVNANISKTSEWFHSSLQFEEMDNSSNLFIRCLMALILKAINDDFYFQLYW